MAIFIMLRVNSKYKERKGTWKMIMMLSLIVVLILILFLYNKDIFHRDTVITIVTNLPLGIFKDENKKKMVIHTKNLLQSVANTLP